MAEGASCREKCGEVGSGKGAHVHAMASPVAVWRGPLVWREHRRGRGGSPGWGGDAHDVVDEVFVYRMGGVAAVFMHVGANVVASSVDHHISVRGMNRLRLRWRRGGGYA